MGTTLTVLSPLRKATWSKVLQRNSNVFYGCPFVEMLQNHPIYGCLIKVKSEYEVKLVNRESTHWYLLVKTKDSTLPYVSLEIRTTNLSDLVQFSREVDSINVEVSSDVGVYEGTLLFLCQLADGVVKEMDSYDLLTSNCQTFCNKLLKLMGKFEFLTSTELLDREIDLLGEALVGRSPRKEAKMLQPSMTKLSITKEKQSSSMAMTAMPTRIHVDLKLPERVPSLLKEDVSSLHKILIPVANAWKSIGSELSLSDQVLESIGTEHCQIADRCLREVLIKYLQQIDPSPSWQNLVDAVAKSNVHVAKSIKDRVKSINEHDLLCSCC